MNIQLFPENGFESAKMDSNQCMNQAIFQKMDSNLPRGIRIQRTILETECAKIIMDSNLNETDSNLIQ